ncbi:carboxypeptidase regulatory-like domain-containing protein [Microbacterium sp.]|uniref:MSCRAMM family protein n=1 Tax=Microbacterium sp. TaxID=51671 RepID=UPI00289A6FB0|nr:carboxypeptidase regulatory-like domain-containing protein [Microbacterium sp.]
MRVQKTGVLAAMIVAFAVVVGAIPAAAATTTAWASWQPLEGSAGAFTSSVQIAANPAITASVTSDSRAGQVGLVSGASTWLAEGTPVGAKYGSSRDQQYMNLRPRVDNATSPSTTTYSFASPTPTSGWTFVLGDIDADAVRIEAIGPDGQALTAEQIGFRGGFNYCAPGIAGKPSCTGSADDVPSWDAGTLTLTGNAEAADTSGSAAWFEPAAPISTLSFVFTRRAGFPVYQTWFASIARDITGSVVDELTGPVEGVELTLVDANGDVVGTTTTAADGSYGFPGFVATDGYTVRAATPAGKVPVGPGEIEVDLTEADGVADFVVRDIVGTEVSGRVVDDEGEPVPGVPVSIDAEQETTTDDEGVYVFDEVPAGEHTVVVTPPPGYSTDLPIAPVVVPEDSEEPILLDDIVIVENPTLSGTVESNGQGLPGVTVTAETADVPPIATVTGAGGGFTFPRVPGGDYTISITVPDGYIATGPTSIDRTVESDDVVDIDFDIARLGSIDGTVVTDGGVPVGGVVITIVSPDETVQLTTDAEGNYGLGELPPGEYTMTITAPSGSTIVGSATRTVVITAAGEAFIDQDFTLQAAVVPTPTPNPPVDPTEPPVAPVTPPGTGNGALPATGLGPETVTWGAVGAGVLVLGAGLFAFSRRRANSATRDSDTE